MLELDPLSIVKSIATAEISISGRLVDASNASLFGTVFSQTGEQEIPIIYKPIAGERPLWDFPDGNLASREVAAYQISKYLGFNIVPFTTLRDGPYGMGAVQQWIEIDEAFDLISFSQTDDPRLREIALFDAVINNTDRKIGHLLMDTEHNLFGIDHGVSLHSENKLRTVLWQWRGLQLTEIEKAQLQRFIAEREPITASLLNLITALEVDALFVRVSSLISAGIFPEPNGEWPAIPWPPI
ncbi:MAG: phosphatidylinositol kinase [Actinobacteria bacterium]|jgi:hypothetical protein|nr:phosphatidylinositol kinase [Actinomycetota bacterium]NDH12712.1 phosphatidylinositol kinase [Actinomycetota bacterium]TRZ85367.1 MAG: phosphatidylinositol kinase [Streptomycetaceae bacterium]